MKRIFFLLVTVFSMTVVNAQNITDALRYSSEHLNGTARFNALSGAFGALGADASAMAINPAGSAIFNKSTGSTTFSVVDKTSKSSYFNTNTKESYANLKLNQAGFIFVINSKNEETLVNKFTFGMNYIATNNYDRNLLIKGVGNTSIGEFFLANAQGIPLNLLQLQQGESISNLYSYLGETEGVVAQNAFLGYQGFILDAVDPDNPDNTQYFSNIAGGSFNQEYYYNTSGNSGKYTFNFALQLDNKFSFGINLNSNNINYTQYSSLYETNNNQNSLVKKVNFDNNLSVYGNGFSGQIGAIIKPLEALRLGLTYDTPIWYNIKEETLQSLETQRVENGNTITQFVNPEIVNVFYEYRLRTPWKITSSVAYVFDKKGLISFDYAYKDYSFIKFSPSNDSAFASENNAIKSDLKGTSNIKIGAEYRVSFLSIRGGYMFEESPYENKITVGNLNKFSFGLGFYLRNFNIDLSYARDNQHKQQQLYSVGLTNSASIKTINNNYAITFKYEI